MILNTIFEAIKFDKSNLSDEDKLKLNEFISICKNKEREVYSNRMNLKSFNQIDFYNSFKGTDIQLDKFIDFLIQEYNYYNIENKSEDEIKNIILEYYNSLSKKMFPKELRIDVTINSIFPIRKNIKLVNDMKTFLMENISE